LCQPKQAIEQEEEDESACQTEESHRGRADAVEIPDQPAAQHKENDKKDVVISVMMKRKKPLFRNVASGIARKWGFLHFTLILITTE
jgi:hypothetical protein